MKSVPVRSINAFGADVTEDERYPAFIAVRIGYRCRDGPSEVSDVMATGNMSARRLLSTCNCDLGLSASSAAATHQ